MQSQYLRPIISMPILMPIYINPICVDRARVCLKLKLIILKYFIGIQNFTVHLSRKYWKQYQFHLDSVFTMRSPPCWRNQRQVGCDHLCSVCRIDPGLTVVSHFNSPSPTQESCGHCGLLQCLWRNPKRNSTSFSIWPPCSLPRFNNEFNTFFQRVCTHTTHSSSLGENIRSKYLFSSITTAALFPRTIRCPLLVMAHQNLNQIVSPTVTSSNTDYPFCPTISLPLSVPLNIMCLLLFGNTRNSR